MTHGSKGLPCLLQQLLLCSGLAFAAGAHGQTEATVPVEMLALDAGLAKGELYGPRMRLNGTPSIGRQPARIFRGIVPENLESKPAFERVLILALLGGVHRDASAAAQSWSNVPKTREAWCATQANTRSIVRCYQDLDGDGRLDVERDGDVFGAGGVALATLGPGRRIEPVAYRAARTEELPLLQVGYESCDLPNQFSLELHWVVEGKLKEGPFGGCRILASVIESSPAVLQVDRFKVAVTDGKIATSIVEGIPAGTLLGSIRSDRPLTNLIDTQSIEQQQKVQVGTRPYLYFSETPSVATGDVAVGEEIVAGPVKHGIKGRLEAPIVIKQSFGRSYEIAAGKAVYGIPMSARESESDLQIVWCLPQLDEKTQRWTTDCFAHSGAGNQRAAVLGTPFAIESLATISNRPATSQPIVERDVGDLGPLRLSVRLKRWTDEHVVLALSVEPQHGKVDAWEYRYKRGANGVVDVRFGRGILKLTPSQSVKNGAAVEMTAPVSYGDVALPFGDGGPVSK